MQPLGAHLRVSMPCRPDSHQRNVPLAGAPAALTLLACQADGVMFALSHAELGEPSRVGPALAALAEAARHNVQGRIESEVPAQVPGMTPQPAARRLTIQGHMPDGRAVITHTVVFAHGTRVYQATVMGGRPAEHSVRTFIDALAVQP